MNAAVRSRLQDGITLRAAALIAGLGYLLSPVTYAEFSVYPKLVVPGRIEQTMSNVSAHATLFAVMMLCYWITLIADIVVAWALYLLLKPVNSALSLLTAWFRLVYAAVALVGTLNLATVFRLLTVPEFRTLFGGDQLRAQVSLSLHSFRYDWSLSLTIFAIHLILLGCLVWRSGYIPKLIGIVLVVDGAGWLIDSLRPYLYPGARLDFLFVTFFGEIVFMAWLLIGGWRIKEPVSAGPSNA